MSQKPTKMKTSNDVIYTVLDGDAVLMHLKSGVYYGLNPVGACVWRKLEKPVSRDEICFHIVETFDVELSTCREDIEVLLMELEEAGLVETVEAHF